MSKPGSQWWQLLDTGFAVLGESACLAVSHGAPQLHAGVGKPGTRRLQRNAASIVYLVVELQVFQIDVVENLFCE